MVVSGTDSVVAALPLGMIGEIRSRKIRSIVLPKQYLDSGQLLSITVGYRDLDLDFGIVDIVAWSLDGAFGCLANLYRCQVLESQGYSNIDTTRQ